MAIATRIFALVAIAVMVGCTAQRSAVSGADGFQEEILADDVVTPAEYERAVYATMSCVEEHGWAVDDPEVGLDGYTLTFAVVWSTAADPHAEDALSAKAAQDFDTCALEYLDRVEAAFARAQVPTGIDRRLAEESLVKCLAAAGVEDVPIGVAEEELIERIVSFENEIGTESLEPWLCRERHISLFVDP